MDVLHLPPHSRPTTRYLPGCRFPGRRFAPCAVPLGGMTMSATDRAPGGTRRIRFPILAIAPSHLLAASPSRSLRHVAACLIASSTHPAAQAAVIVAAFRGMTANQLDRPTPDRPGIPRPARPLVPTTPRLDPRPSRSRVELAFLAAC